MKIFGFDYSNEGFYHYIMKNLYGQQRLITGNYGIFNSSAPAAYGANAFYNAMNQYDEDASIQYMNRNINGYYNMEAALGFAGAKLSHTDSYGNSDGKVSVEEYTGTLPPEMNKQVMLEGLDVNEDGFISAGEEAAFSLLTDYLDGSSDGVITKNGRMNSFYLINNYSDNFIQNMEFIYNNYTKQYEENFETPWNEIDGSKGPYDSDTAVGKGANVGAKILDLYLKGKNDELAYSNYQYMHKDENGDLDIDSGLASHTYIMQTYDKNRDGKVSSWEVSKKIFDITDLNGDGELSAGEHLARSMAADTNNDGKITYDEKRAFQVRLNDNSNKDEIFQEIKDAYNNNSIEEKEENFEMPEKTGNGFPPSYGNPYGYQGYSDYYSYFLNILYNLSQRFRL